MWFLIKESQQNVCKVYSYLSDPRSKVGLNEIFVFMTVLLT